MSIKSIVFSVLSAVGVLVGVVRTDMTVFDKVGVVKTVSAKEAGVGANW